VVAWVGAVTALVAATIALVNHDIKRVLAYSTISQLGYMFLAVGVGAYVAAIFHMVTHAFFKALLFLGAGSVMHGLHDEQDMRRMGGLRKYMPITAGTFIVGWLAIAGVVPFAGFWSKDEILAGAFVQGQYALWAVGAVTALLTALYMTRQVLLVFFGEERWRDRVKGTPHESPGTMTIPLVVLAGLSFAGGALNLPAKSFEFLGHWLEPVFEGVPAVHPESFSQGFVLATIALVLAVVGGLAAFALYRRGLPDRETDPLEARLGPLATTFARGWYLDAAVAAFVDRVGRPASVWLADFFDQKGIDGAVNGTAGTISFAGRRLRLLQTGFLRNYALAVFGGGTLMLFFLLLRGGG
ncbi:MAG: proton-conducting transporter membrane subunit, partial [Acidimicrobiia bacterium]